jgi:hypothetical protein
MAPAKLTSSTGTMTPVVLKTLDHDPVPFQLHGRCSTLRYHDTLTPLHPNSLCPTDVGPLRACARARGGRLPPSCIAAFSGSWFPRRPMKCLAVTRERWAPLADCSRPVIIGHPEAIGSHQTSLAVRFLFEPGLNSDGNL